MRPGGCNETREGTALTLVESCSEAKPNRYMKRVYVATSLSLQ